MTQAFHQGGFRNRRQDAEGARGVEHAVGDQGMDELLGMNPLPLALVVMFAASTSFLSPVGYQTNTMIFGTGVLKFTDFARVGGPLNLILMVVTSISLYLLRPVT